MEWWIFFGINLARILFLISIIFLYKYGLNYQADDLFSSLDFGGSPPLTASSLTTRVESSSNIKASESGLN